MILLNRLLKIFFFMGAMLVAVPSSSSAGPARLITNLIFDFEGPTPAPTDFFYFFIKDFKDVTLSQVNSRCVVKEQDNRALVGDIDDKSGKTFFKHPTMASVEWYLMCLKNEYVGRELTLAQDIPDKIRKSYFGAETEAYFRSGNVDIKKALWKDVPAKNQELIAVNLVGRIIGKGVWKELHNDPMETIRSTFLKPLTNFAGDKVTIVEAVQYLTILVYASNEFLLD